MSDMRSLIRRKRSGGELSEAEIQWLVEGAVAGRITDYQLSAWLMACCFTHLSEAETLAMTKAFVASGEQLSWQGVDRPIVDKHSTGGVGDKVSLVLLPWLAAAGLALPKMSGRGLGHTGGTLDKLDAIPGFSTELDQAGMSRLLDSVGCCIAGQSERLVPADKLFYALRDATETVDELGLIVASVLSKKLACGAPCIVLDVKHGSGAFFRNESAALNFATQAENIASAAGRRLKAVLHAMDQPLGWAVGNALEVQEAAQLLQNKRESPELLEACLSLGSAALMLTGRCSSDSEARSLLSSLLDSGQAAESFARWVAAQGGDWEAFETELAHAQQSYRKVAVLAPQSGRLTRLDALALGLLACDIGAGRKSKSDQIDPWVGIECLAKVGASVVAGEPLAHLTVRPDEVNGDEQLTGRFLEALGLSPV